MLLEKKINMIFPSKELGKKIASEDCKTQCQVLEGFASRQLLESTYNHQTVINLVAILPSETILWIIEMYQELVKQDKLPRLAIEYNKELVREALDKTEHENVSEANE